MQFMKTNEIPKINTMFKHNVIYVYICLRRPNIIHVICTINKHSIKKCYQYKNYLFQDTTRVLKNYPSKGTKEEKLSISLI